MPSPFLLPPPAGQFPWFLGQGGPRVLTKVAMTFAQAIPRVTTFAPIPGGPADMFLSPTTPGPITMGTKEKNKAWVIDITSDLAPGPPAEQLVIATENITVYEQPAGSSQLTVAGTSIGGVVTGVVQSVTISAAGPITVLLDNANVHLGSTYYIDGTVQTNATPTRITQWMHNRTYGIYIPA